MKTMRFICLMFVGVLLFGDIMYEMTTTTKSIMGKGKGAGLFSRAFIKGDASKTEMGEAGGPVKMITIVRLDKKLMWLLTPDKKTYTETSLPVKTASSAKEDTLAQVPEINIQKTAEKKMILNKECEKVIITMKSAGAKGGGFSLTQTMWVTKNFPAGKEIKDYNNKFMELAGVSGSGMAGKSDRSQKEFQRKINEIDGFPLEVDLDMTTEGGPMKFTMTTHSVVTKIDASSINISMFELPAGYKLTK